MSPLLGPPLSDNPRLTRACQGWDSPIVEGSISTATEKKIRKGVQPPFPGFAGMIDRHAENGGTIDKPYAFALAFILALHERWGVPVSTLDLDTAVAQETDAEGEANHYDVRACAWRSLTTAQKKAYEVAAWKDATASRLRALSVTARIHRDEMETQAAVARLSTRPA